MSSEYTNLFTNNSNHEISDEQAKKLLFSNQFEATQIIDDKDKIEDLLQRVENKLKEIPVAGEQLSKIPLMISLVRSYLKGDYENLPVGTLISIVCAFLYLLSPLDLIPDTIPGVGILDDVAVIGACLKLIDSDLEDYKNWRAQRANQKTSLFS